MYERNGARPARIAIAILLSGLALSLAAAVFSLASDQATIIGRFVPDSVAYPAHVGLARLILQVSPTSSAGQWLRAASHADSDDRLDAAANGLATARRQSSYDWDLDDRLCTQFVHAA